MKIRNLSLISNLILLSSHIRSEELRVSKTPIHHAYDFFEEATVTKTNMQFRFKSSGQRFLYRVGDSPLKRNEYDETVSLQMGETFLIIGRHNNIIFKPMSDATKDYGFVAQSEIDKRSLGGEINTASLFVATFDVTGTVKLDSESVRLIEAVESSISAYVNEVQTNIIHREMQSDD